MANISSNSILFIGLANEYCKILESTAASGIEKETFVNKLLQLLPRIYIAISDFKTDGIEDNDIFIDTFLDEVYYDSIRRNAEMLLGEDDTFLEVFEEDMKFSDSPIAVSISEYLADIFQYLYDFINAVKDASDEHLNSCLCVCKENFEIYWGQTLCNVLRALHRIKYDNQL